MKPLLILGLDGLDPYFLDEHLDELDSFRELDDRGILESTLPPITVPAWMCSYTGQKPEELGRFDFQEIDFDSYSFRPTPYGIEGREFWSYSDEKIALADVPSAPVREVNGWILGGLFNTGGRKSYPEELMDEVSKDLGDFEIEGLENYSSERKRREKAFDFFEKRRNTLDWLINNRDSDVYFMVFRLPDTMMHHCSSGRDMLEAYRSCDEYLGELMERDLNLLVVSDHGAVRATRRFSVNTWLREKGYLEEERQRSSGFSDGFRSLALRAAEIAERVGLRDLLVRANEVYGDLAGEKFVSAELDLDSIDWSGTEAFSYMTGVCRYAGIWINDDRFPKGAVDDTEARKREIKEEMERHELVEEVLTKEEAFEVEARTFPDLVVVLEEKVKSDSDLKPSVTGKISSYMHRKQGFVGLHGDVFDMKEENAKLIDLAPTVLHYFGDVIPGEMDGKVMDIFAEDSEPDSREPEYTSTDVAGLDV